MSIHTEVTQEDSQTLQGNNTFTGINTFSGPINSSNINTFTGSNTFSGGLLASTFAGIRYADQFAGSDIGAKINAAYANLPTNGGTIYVRPCGSVPGDTCTSVVLGSGTLSCWAFSTPIVFGTAGKPAELQGSPATTCLNFTPTSGSAITWDWKWNDSSAQHEHAAGMNGIWLLGSGGTSTGIETATITNHGVIHPVIQKSAIQGFNNGIDFSVPGGAFFLDLWDSGIKLNLSCGINIVTSTENITSYHTDYYGNGTSLCISGGGALDFYNFGSSFDGDTTTAVSISQGFFDCYGCHFENAGVTGCTGVRSPTQHFIQNSGGVVRLFGGTLQDDCTTGTADYLIQLSGTSYLEMFGTAIGGGSTITAAINPTSNSPLINGVGVFYGTNVTDSNAVPTSFAGTIHWTSMTGRDFYAPNGIGVVLAAGKTLSWGNLGSQDSGFSRIGWAGGVGIAAGNSTQGDITNNLIARRFATGIASNTDSAIKLIFSAATTASYTFTATYAQVPVCTISPVVPGALLFTITTLSTTTLTVTASGSFTGTVNAVCIPQL